MLVFQPAFLFQPADHDANRRIARRIRQTDSNFLRRCAIAEREDGIHDFPFSP
jgi:hypothetical protein